MIFEYANKGVCSRKTIVEPNDDKTIKSVKIIGGCSGNTQGVATLLTGMKVDDAISRLEGIDCNGRGTSCPDQIAKALRAAAAQN